MNKRYQELVSEICENLWLTAIDWAEWAGVSNLEEMRRETESRQPLDCLKDLMDALNQQDGFPNLLYDLLYLLENTVPVVKNFANGEVAWAEALDVAKELLQDDYPNNFLSTAQCALATLKLAREFSPEGRRTREPLVVEQRVPGRTPTLFEVKTLSERPWEQREKEFWALFFAASIEAGEAEEAAQAWLDIELGGEFKAVEVSPPRIDDLPGQLASVSAVLADRHRRRDSSSPIELFQRWFEKVDRKLDLIHADTSSTTRMVRTGVQALLRLGEEVREVDKKLAQLVSLDSLEHVWAKIAAESRSVPSDDGSDAGAIACVPLEQLDPRSRDSLLAYRFLKEDGDQPYLRQATLALCCAFERELRGALERHGAPVPEHSDMSLSSCLRLARGTNTSVFRRVYERLEQEPTREETLTVIRNTCAHTLDHNLEDGALLEKAEALVLEGPGGPDNAPITLMAQHRKDREPRA